MRALNNWALACAIAFGLASAVPAAAQATGQSGSSGQPQGGQPGATGQTGGATDVGGSQPGSSSGSQPGSTNQASRQNNSQDRLQKFVDQAAIDNMAEIQLGQLAQQKAQDPQVKQFAQTMVDEHTKALDQLKQAASSSGLSVPSSLDKKHQKIQDKLSNANGSDFDRQYMNVMVKDHNSDKKLLEKRAGKENASSSYGGGTSATGTGGTAGTSGTSGTSGTTSGTSGMTGTSGVEGSGSSTSATASAAGASSIDAWAVSTLPEVEHHLQQAKDLQKQIKNEGKNSGNNSKDQGRR